jgi:hypothetical protein
MVAIMSNTIEKQLKPEEFAEILCEDLKLPHAHFVPLIASEIKSQVQENFSHFPSQCLPLTSARGSPSDNGSKDDQELRILIKLDITLYNYSLVDQFEWDIMCKRNDPELFAQVMVKELGLDSEFISAISHSIREQVQVFASALLLLDYKFDGSRVTDEELGSLVMPPLEYANLLRPMSDMNKYGPKYVLASSVSDKIAKDAQRDRRRQRRQTNRSRRNLSKVETQKTIRTPIGLYHNASVALSAGFILSGSQPRELHTELAEKYKNYVEKENHSHELVRVRTLPHHSSPEKTIWRCMVCQKTRAETEIIRMENLCNKCGLYFSHHGSLPVVNNSSSSMQKVTYPSLYINNLDYLNRLIKKR